LTIKNWDSCAYLQWMFVYIRNLIFIHVVYEREGMNNSLNFMACSRLETWTPSFSFIMWYNAICFLCYFHKRKGKSWLCSFHPFFTFNAWPFHWLNTRKLLIKGIYEMSVCSTREQKGSLQIVHQVEKYYLHSRTVNMRKLLFLERRE